MLCALSPESTIDLAREDGDKSDSYTNRERAFEGILLLGDTIPFIAILSLGRKKDGKCTGLVPILSSNTSLFLMQGILSYIST